MKNPFTSLKFILVIVLFAAMSASAQVTTNINTDANGNVTTTVGSAPVAQSQVPTNSQNFFVSVGHFFTSANTNYTWVSNRLEAATGGDYMGGLQWANYVSAQADIGSFDVEGKVRNIGVAGVIDTVEAGAGYTLIQYCSVKAQASLLAGYDFTKEAALVEPTVTVKDKMTPNTYIELGASVPIWLQKALNKTPDFFIGAGFTY